MKPTTNQPLHSSAKKTVSIGSIFKQPARVGKTRGTTPKHKKDTSTTKGHSTSSRSNARDQQKAKSRALKKQAELHPLALAFRDGSEEYRRQIYQTVMSKVNGTLEQLLNNLHESTLQIAPSKDGKTNTDASPVRLSITAKYEQMAMRLYQPLSQFKLTFNQTNSEGQRRSFQSTLETRMENYEDYVAKKKSEIAQLQKDWEVIVGEIWKLGVTCLGEDVMKDLLFSPQDTAEESEADLTLFVPEEGTSPAASYKPPGSKKHVTFETDEEADVALNFLYQPSLYRSKPATVPVIADGEMDELEAGMSSLGQKQLGEFKKIEKDHQEFWKKKNAQLTKALKND